MAICMEICLAIFFGIDQCAQCPSRSWSQKYANPAVMVNVRHNLPCSAARLGFLVAWARPFFSADQWPYPYRHLFLQLLLQSIIPAPVLARKVS